MKVLEVSEVAGGGSGSSCKLLAEFSGYGGNWLL